MLHPESFVQIINVLGKKLEPSPLAAVIVALAPLVGSAPPPAAGVKKRSRCKAQPKAPAQAPSQAPSKAEPGEPGPGERCRAALERDPSLNATQLAAAASCSRSTAVMIIQERAGIPRPRPSTRSSQKAQALLRKQLSDGPKRAEEIESAAEAAEIPERSLVAAATALGVVTKNGEWRLPG